MSSKDASKTASSSTFYHALLRPAILQILRAQGYYGCSPAVLDTVTELASRYLTTLSHFAAEYASHNHEEDPSSLTLVDVRMALEDGGALQPSTEEYIEDLRGREDLRGVDEFVRWAKGKKNAKIRKVANALPPAEGMEGVEEAVTDYLNALKKKHNKTDLDSKYAGTVLGKGIDHGEIQVEGGETTSIQDWARQLREAQQRPPAPLTPDSRPSSSGLSSMADRDVEMLGMDLS